MNAATVATPHVLAIADDPAMREFFSDYLGQNNLRVTAVATAREMREVLDNGTFDLIALDRRLASEDGIRLAVELRETSAIPIILVSGCSDEADRVLGLELAADDYITKPFSARELLARIRAVLRRYQRGAVAPRARNKSIHAYRFAGWELNLRTRRLTGTLGRRVELTNGEFSLLEVFCSAPQRVLTRERLIGLSRLRDAEVYDRSVDVQILRLRRKIEDNPSRPEYIKTQRGAGYLFDTSVEVL